MRNRRRPRATTAGAEPARPWRGAETLNGRAERGLQWQQPTSAKAPMTGRPTYKNRVGLFIGVAMAGMPLSSLLFWQLRTQTLDSRSDCREVGRRRDRPGQGLHGMEVIRAVTHAVRQNPDGRSFVLAQFPKPRSTAPADKLQTVLVIEPRNWMAGAPSRERPIPPLSHAQNFCGRARKALQNAHDLNAKHSHDRCHGKHLQRRAREGMARKAGMRESPSASQA